MWNRILVKMGELWVIWIVILCGLVYLSSLAVGRQLVVHAVVASVTCACIITVNYMDRCDTGEARLDVEAVSESGNFIRKQARLIQKPLPAAARHKPEIQRDFSEPHRLW